MNKNNANNIVIIKQCNTIKRVVINYNVHTLITI
jgi:hypothetical protein